jgi:hypothetical protein
MKVSLYVRQRGTREQKKLNPKKSYPHDGSITCLRSSVETLDDCNFVPIRLSSRMSRACPSPKCYLRRKWRDSPFLSD